MKLENMMRKNMGLKIMRGKEKRTLVWREIERFLSYPMSLRKCGTFVNN
jgi:hypothetical protein